MRTFKLITLSILMSASVAFSGERGGNGGGGQDCGDSIELYDFFEGRHPDMHSIKLWKQDPAIDRATYIKMAMDHLKQDLPSIHPKVEKILNQLLAIPTDQLIRRQTIPFIPDADIFFLEQGCSYVQIANWNERFEKVVISKDFFERLDSMGQAGLFIHEALYKVARDSKVAKNSDDIRKIVAMLFSDEKLSFDEEKKIYNSGFQSNQCKSSIDFASQHLSIFTEITKYCKKPDIPDREEARKLARDNEETIKNLASTCLKECTDDNFLKTCSDILSLPYHKGCP